jgi:glycerol-3-phosphate acyltransferase PlsY
MPRILDLMPVPMLTAGLVLLAYLIGSLPFAVIVSRAFGLADPRSFGSGNTGATNVLRSGNKAAALLTLVGDAAKGWLAVFLAQQFAPGDVAWVAVAVFCGHVFSVFLKFQGGKGVATAAGVLLGLSPWLGLAVIATWVAVAALTRYSSLAAVCATGAAALFAFALLGETRSVAAVGVISVLVLWRHKSNIANLLGGRESKIGQKG